MERCTSCKKNIMNDRGSVSFLCPRCSKLKIIRCTNCRQNATKYYCSQCGFDGPN